MRLRSLFAGALLCCAAGCQVVPEDHLLRIRLAQSFARLQAALDPRPELADAARRLPRMVDRAQALSPFGASELQRVQQLPDRIAGIAGDQAVHGPHRAAATALELARADGQAVARLAAPDSALRRALAPQAAARRMQHAVDRLPAVLGLDRRPLPSPTDPERQTGTAPAERRETWVERFLRRVPP